MDHLVHREYPTYPYRVYLEFEDISVSDVMEWAEARKLEYNVDWIFSKDRKCEKLVRFFGFKDKQHAMMFRLRF